VWVVLPESTLFGTLVSWELLIEVYHRCRIFVLMTPEWAGFWNPLISPYPGNPSGRLSVRSNPPCSLIVEPHPGSHCIAPFEQDSSSQEVGKKSKKFIFS